jgi:hypothetical protein
MAHDCSPVHSPTYPAVMFWKDQQGKGGTKYTRELHVYIQETQVQTKLQYTGT